MGTDERNPGAPPSNWSDIQELALSFDGYEAAGSFEACAAVANGMSDRFRLDGPRALEGATTDDLGYALFFEQRRWRHFGDDPDALSLRYIRALVVELGRRHGVGLLWARVRTRRAEQER